MSPQMSHPRLRLDFYSADVLMSRWEEDGRIIAHPVSIHDVVDACTNSTMSSGLLPANTLFWQRQAVKLTLGIYVPARRWRMRLDVPDHDDGRIFHIPMPPFIFVGAGNSYQIYAVKRRPVDAREPLYHAPCPNVHAGGNICLGNAPFPSCSAQTIEPALTLFMENSLFNGDLSRGKCHRYPDDVRRLWDELEGKQRFPLSQLAARGANLGALL